MAGKVKLADALADILSVARGSANPEAGSVAEQFIEQGGEDAPTKGEKSEELQVLEKRIADLESKQPTKIK
jgi:hypothetical protein